MASKAQDPARAARPSAGPGSVAVAQVRGLRGRADRDRNPALVTNGDLARIAVKPLLSAMVGSASGGSALARRLARDWRFAVFLAAVRVLRLTGRLARLFDAVSVLDPAVGPRAGVFLARLLQFFVHHDSRLFRPLDQLFNVFGYGCLRNSSLDSGAPSYSEHRLVSVLRAGRECVLPGDGDARDREQDTGEGCEYDSATHAD